MRTLDSKDPIDEDTTHSGHMTWRNQAGTDLEASSLWTSFHSTRRGYAGCMRTVVNSLTQL